MPRNERLRYHRIQRNWRQQDLADQLQTSLVTIQRWERGNQTPSAYYRVKLCALFNLSAQELGFQEASSSERETQEAEPLRVLPSSEVELWTVPYKRNPHFTGRTEQLDQLEQRLLPLGRTESIHRTALTQAQAITGLGGIGKTQIAVEYTYRARAQGHYTHTLWITATSEEAILTNFAAIADQLPAIAAKGEIDQHQIAATMVEWLEQCEQAWLLIFDNADDLSLIQPYLPRWGNGSVLLTTRASAVGSFAASIEVETMSMIEGIQLLLHRALHIANASDKEINDAGNLVVALGQFPLALDQAGAYIEETGCSIHDYLHLYQQHGYMLLARRGKQVTGYPDSVAMTWSLSIEHIERTNPGASDLLRLCAYLSPDHIPEELLTEGAPYWPPALRQAVADPLLLNEIIAELLRFSLVKRLAEDHLLSLHRLVQLVQRERQKSEEQRQWAERVIRAVHTVFPRDPTNPIATWSQCQRYLEQAQACDMLIQKYQILLPEAADLLERTGTYLRECALYTLAEPLYQRALHLREQLLGSEHPDTAATLNDLAILSYEQGKYTQAEPLFQRAIHICEHQLGPEHPDTAATQHNLASIYYQLGRYEEAEPLFQQALRIREMQLGPDHPDVASSLSNIANMYRNQGKYTQAEPLYRRALRIREQLLGPEHPGVATILHDFAGFLQAHNKTKEAAHMYQRALTIREQVLGVDHPLTNETRSHSKPNVREQTAQQ